MAVVATNNGPPNDGGEDQTFSTGHVLQFHQSKAVVLLSETNRAVQRRHLRVDRFVVGQQNKGLNMRKASNKQTRHIRASIAVCVQ